MFSQKCKWNAEKSPKIKLKSVSRMPDRKEAAQTERAACRSGNETDGAFMAPTA